MHQEDLSYRFVLHNFAIYGRGQKNKFFKIVEFRCFEKEIFFLFFLVFFIFFQRFMVYRVAFGVKCPGTTFQMPGHLGASARGVGRGGVAFGAKCHPPLAAAGQCQGDPGVTHLLVKILITR